MCEEVHFVHVLTVCVFARMHKYALHLHMYHVSAAVEATLSPLPIYMSRLDCVEKRTSSTYVRDSILAAR
jgi:hypothetical protein